MKVYGRRAGRWRGTIVYLDAEDEITSAAARIRAADDARVGLVLPFGSRVATSRINFRLLAARGDGHRPAAGHRGARRVRPGARGLGGAAGVRVGGGVRVGARRARRRRRPDDRPARPRAAGGGSRGSGRRRGRCRGGDGRPHRRRRATPPRAARPRADHRARVRRLRRAGHRDDVAARDAELVRRPPRRARSRSEAAARRPRRAPSRSASSCSCVLGAGAVGGRHASCRRPTSR